ncbi:MAG: Asp23/Gls24 family envelope stress response protein [Coriobacteriia bacterium]|nr:Asp23/Gls24 family envelope stress response protein [Coriobacteriia bacterium]MCL2537150.1 Asp23/Gls24 family envelope stress response protein [Coriobacteriia bacterium]
MTAELTGGAIHISNEVLADLAGYSAMESYGVVGMAAPSLRDGLVQLLPQNKLRRGVRITNSVDEAGEPLASTVEVDLYVVIEYGTQLAEVSRNLADRVRYTLTTMTEIKVERVDVHVLEVKVRQGA